MIQDGYRSDPETHVGPKPLFSALISADLEPFCFARLQPWANAEVRAFTFASVDDEDAKLVLVKEVAKEGEEEPTSGEMKN